MKISLVNPKESLSIFYRLSQQNKIVSKSQVQLIDSSGQISCVNLECSQLLPKILLELAVAYYYDSIFKEKNIMYQILYLTRKEFQNAERCLALLFQKATYIEIFEEMHKENLIQIKVNGISPKGRDLIENLIPLNQWDMFLVDMYIKRVGINFSEAKGLYKCYDTEDRFDPNFRNVFSQISYLKAIDISSLSLEQCCQNSWINSIVKDMDAYIYVDIFNGVCQKSLIWL